MKNRLKLLLILTGSLIILILITNITLAQNGYNYNIKFVDNYFDHASPLAWDMQGDTIMKIFLLPDYEREALNRQTTHWYFGLEADKGTEVRFIISLLLRDVYNGRISSGTNRFEHNPCYISYDNKTWEALETTKIPGNELLVEFTMENNYVYIARMPPYTISDLDDLKNQIEENKQVRIFNIGSTLEGRPLEIIQLGNANANNSFIIRARAHPWESGGNWLAEGLIKEFLSQNSKQWQEEYCVYIMPMANKDGVQRGISRFNIKGKDLNRNWDRKADPVLCPEKFALEQFIEHLISKGKKPCLGIDIHNDSYGGIRLARYCKENADFKANMKLFESLMREHTSYSERVAYSAGGDVWTFSCGMYKQLGIEAIVYELNANWTRSLDKLPAKNDWMDIGRNINKVFYEYSKGRNN